MDYNFERKAVDMKKYVDGQMPNFIEKVNGAKELQAFEDKAARNGLPQVLLFTAKVCFHAGMLVCFVYILVCALKINLNAQNVMRRCRQYLISPRYRLYKHYSLIPRHWPSISRRNSDEGC